MAKKQNNSNESVDTTEEKFVNPFDKGVTYSDFIEALGNKSIAEYCGEHLSVEQVIWLENEIEHFKNKK